MTRIPMQTSIPVSFPTEAGARSLNAGDDYPDLGPPHWWLHIVVSAMRHELRRARKRVSQMIRRGGTPSQRCGAPRSLRDAGPLWTRHHAAW